jgi:hypothetical protein
MTDAVAHSLREWGELDRAADVAAAVARVNPDLRRSVTPGDGRQPPSDVGALAKLLSAQLGPHHPFDAGDVVAAGWWDDEILEYRRVVRRQRLDFLAENARLLSDYEAVLVDSKLLQRELDRWREMPMIRTMRAVKRRIRPTTGE